MTDTPYSTDPVNIALAELVRSLTGPTQADLAKRLGISAGQLSRVLSGERKATMKHVETLRKMREKR